MLQNVKRHGLIFNFFLLLFFANTTYCYEYIDLFKSDITVLENGSITITETITIISTGAVIKHGISRDFPTTYKNRLGNVVKVGFTITSISQDGNRVPYKITPYMNGERIHIGDPNKILSPGKHIFTITYTTTRQLGFFETYDELYWNVTGNDNTFPIARAEALVHLPQAIPRHSIMVEAYTGRAGSKEHHFISNILPNNTISISTTRLLDPYEGLTIAIAWPKGYIQAPSLNDKIYYFIIDNLYTIWLFLGLLIVIAFYAQAIRKIRKEKPKKAIIPLFGPPQGLSAASVRYIKNMKFDKEVMASAIVDMAVRGALKIELYKKFFKKYYKLIKTDDAPTLLFPEYKRIERTLFATSPVAELNRYNSNLIQATEALEVNLRSLYGDKLFDFNIDILVWGILLSLAFLLIPLPFVLAPTNLINFFLFFGLILINVISFSLLQTYTSEGWHIRQHIDGFELFLKTTELDRLKIIGTPPTRTPELYEAYLPYAIALGIEEQWTRQFAPMFEQMKKQGHPYVPIWYAGLPGTFNAHQLSSGINNSLNLPISSSRSIPGSSSGSGGRGSSGGGGGGGGVSGW